MEPEKCGTSSDGLRLVRTFETSLVADCTNCGVDEATTQYWELKIKLDSGFQPLPWPGANARQLASNKTLVIKPDFWTPYPDDSTRFQFIYHLKREDGSESHVMTYVQPDIVPNSGSCSVDRTTGVAIVDAFTLICQNWRDSDDGDILALYHFYGSRFF